MASPALITKRRKTQRPAPGTGSPEHSRRVFGGRTPKRVTHPSVLAREKFSSLKEWCSLLADLFIQLRFSNSCHGLGLGLIPRRTVSKRVTATGNVQRGFLPWERWCVGLPPPPGCNYTFYVFKLKKSRRHQKTIRRERARLTKARGEIFFLFFFWYTGFSSELHKQRCF